MTAAPTRRAIRLTQTIRAAQGLAVGAAGGWGLDGITRKWARLAALLRQADHARANALFAATGNDGLPRPLLADWVWRPVPWQGSADLPATPGSGSALAQGVKLFHDGSDATRLTLAQALSGPAPAPLDLRVAALDGTYVSLVVDLPAAALAGLSRQHLIGVAWGLRSDGAFPIIFARINVVCGPNRHQAQRRLPVREGGGAMLAEFDMLDLGINPRRVDAIWCDLVFSYPPAGTLRIEDLILYRRPRAGV